MIQGAEPLEAVLRRLKQERDEADARYNAALTALDRAIRPAASIPSPVPALDEEQLAALNAEWNILPAPPQASGFRARLTGYIWRVIGPYLQRQLTFNSRVVDHLNRQAERQRESYRALEAATAALRDYTSGLAEFQARLLQYLQQVTAYVDTKDRDTASGALVLNASLSGLAENVAKHAESMAAREYRYEARTAAIADAQRDLLGTVGTLQHGFMTVKREIERLAQSSGHVEGAGDARPAPGATEPATRGVEPGPAASDRGPRRPAPGSRIDPDLTRPFSPSLDAYKYVGFEDQFRGSRETIRARLESYLPLFDGSADVLDVGCGRGEFLDLLAAHGIVARGIDLNHEMAELCRSRGLDVTEADAVGYLLGVPDGSVGGIFSAQVVEHLQPQYLLQFLELAFHKIRPGGRLVLETLNPACWVAFFDSYIRDITHVWPLHPETLRYLVVASGFTQASVEFRSPVSDEDRLQRVALPAGTDGTVTDLAEAFNGNVDKLNERMFTFRDYAVVAQKPQPARPGATS
jgi:SAM-dependent methyltransferase